MRFGSFLGPALPYINAAFVAAAAIAYVLTPLVRRVAVHVDAVDQPDHRRVNVVPMPRGGGIAVATAFLAVGVALSVVNANLHFLPVPFAVDFGSLVALFLGGALAAAFGVLDDYFDLRARWQFAGQLGLALFAIATGFVVEFIANPLGSGSRSSIQLPTAIAIGFSILWIAGMINSIRKVKPASAAPPMVNSREP